MRFATASAALAAAWALAACAAPPALQIASFAADGLAYLATGKGTTDHALSMATESDCRMSNVLKGRDLCRAAAARPAPAPAEGVPPALGIALHSSAGSNLAEITGAPPDARLAGEVDPAGTLHVFLVAGDGGRGGAALFTVPGYAREPGLFTGVVMGPRFFAPESLIR